MNELPTSLNCSQVPDNFPSVLPLSSQISFIDFHRPGEDLGNILGECTPDEGESPQDPASFQRGPESDVLAALLDEEPGDDLLPLIPGQVQGEPMRSEIIPAPRTPTLPGPEQVYFFRPAFWTLDPRHLSLVLWIRGRWLKYYYTLNYYISWAILDFLRSLVSSFNLQFLKIDIL